MRSVDHPLILIPFGAGAEDVLRRVGAPGRDADVAVVRGPDPAAAADAFEADLHRLLRAGGRGEAGPRVDLVAVVDALTAWPESVNPTLSALADRIETRFRAVLAPRAGADQRPAALQVVVLAPPLVPHGPAREVLDGAAACAGTAGKPVDSLLARVWLISAQTTAGLLSTDDQVAATAGFLSAMFGCGARDQEPIRQRLAFGDAERRLAMVSVGRLDLPTDRLKSFVETRAAWEAADELVQRVNAPPSGVIGLPDALDPARALAPLVDGEVVRGLPALGEPDRIRRALHDAEQIAARAAVAAGADLLEGPLGARHRLDQLGGMLHALEGAAAAAEAAMANDAVDLAGSTPVPHPPAPPVSAADRDPSALGAADRTYAVATATAAGASVALALAARLSAPAATSAALSTTVVTTTTAASSGAPMLIQSALAAAVGGAIVGGIAWLLTRPPPPAAPARPDPSASARLPSWIPAAVRVTRNRVRRQLATTLRSVAERLHAQRAVLVAARDGLRQELEATGARLAPQPADDGLDALLGPEAPLHGHLLPAREIARWLSRTRTFSERAVWADHVLAAIRPADGLRTDLPAADRDALRAAARTQADGMEERSLFSDEDTARTAAERTVLFLGRAVHALAPAVQARDTHGDPVQPQRGAEILVILPEAGKGALIDVTHAAGLPHLQPVWAPDAAPRVLIVRTFEGLRADDLRRGAGIGGGR